MTKKSKSITSEQIKRVAKLAHLTFSDKDVKRFSSQLSNVLGFMEQIDEMKTSSAKETSQTTGIINRYREDKIEPKRILSQKQALSQAKKTYQGYFVVKSIFD